MPGVSGSEPLLTLRWRQESMSVDVGGIAIVRLEGREAVSELFEFRLDLVSDAEVSLGARDLLGRRLTVVVQRDRSPVRYISGVVRRFVAGKRDGRYRRSVAYLAPDLWRATQRRHSRIFQQQTVPQIVEDVLRDLHLPSADPCGPSRMRFSLSDSHRPLNYCVQYEETDYDFVTRLLHEEGMFFCFEHDAADHTLIISDRSYLRPELAEQPVLRFDETEGGNRSEARIYDWANDQQICPGKFAQWDYWFKEPTRTLASARHVGGVDDSSPDFSLGNSSSLEIYSAGRVAHQQDCDAESPSLEGEAIAARRGEYAQLALERATSAAVVIQAGGDIPPVTPGYRFTLADHFEDDGDYFVLSVTHRAEQPDPLGAKAGVSVYANEFTCLPNLPSLPYRPAAPRSRPVIPGTQTATVVGPANEEIHVDRYGRIKVHFHWDRRDKENGHNTCWIRVAQFWAGKRFGAFFWPRVGQEVVVGFEDGDPDRPIVLGSVYNGKNMPPLELPAEKRTTGVKSCTVGGDPEHHFNCVMFHDQPGDEHLCLHSETYECLTSETAKFDFSAGPRFHVTEPKLPALGSGAGGGINPFQLLVSAIGDTFSELTPHFLRDHFPVSEAKFTGSTYDAVMFGSRQRHTFFGDNLALHYKFDQLLFGGSTSAKIGSIIGSIVATGVANRQAISDYFKGNSADADRVDKHKAPKWLDMAGKAAKAALIPDGATDLLAGAPRNWLIYQADLLEVIRGGERFSLSTKKFWRDLSNSGIVVKALIFQIGTSALLYDLLASNRIIVDETKDSEGRPANTSTKTDAWWWLEWVAGDIAVILSGALQFLETKLAKLDKSEQESLAAAEELEQAAEMARTYATSTTADAIATRLQQAELRLGESANGLANTVAELSAALRELQPDNGDLRQTIDGKYRLHATNAAIRTHDPVSSTISLNAVAGLPLKPGGSVAISGNRNVSINSGSAGIDFTTRPDGSSIDLGTSGMGKISIHHGPVAPMGTAITIDSTPGVSERVVINSLDMKATISKNEIDLQAGAIGRTSRLTLGRGAATLATNALTIKASSITLSDPTGVTKLMLTSEGFKLIGPTISFEANLAQQMRTMMMNVNT